MTLRWKKGTVLLQTLVMSVILSMIAVSLMKWVLARYMMAARNYRSVAATARSVGYLQDRVSSWGYQDMLTGTAPPGGGSASVDGKTVSFTASGGAMKTVTITSDEDQ